MNVHYGKDGRYKAEFPKARNGHYRWRFRCLNNGKITASSGQAFWKTKQSAERAFKQHAHVLRNGLIVG